MKSVINYLIAILTLSFTALHAQTFSIGAEGEVTTSTVKINNIPNSFVQSVNGKNIMGYEIGPYFKIGLGSLYIKPKVLVSYQSGMVQAIYPDQSATNVDLTVTRLDIPVLVGLKVIGPLSIEAGPAYNRILTVTKDYNGSDIDVSMGGLGYRVGANAQFGFVGLNVAYQGIKNSSSSSLSSFETPNELIFGLSLGF